MNRRAFVAAVGGTALAPGVAALAAAVPEVDLRPTDVTLGEDRQWLRLTVAGLDADRLALAVDVTPLAGEANVDLSALAVDDEETEVYDAELSDAAVEREEDGDRVSVRLAFAVDGGADAFRARVALTGLGTTDAEHASDLTYEVDGATGDGAAEEVGESAAFDVVDPARREPELSFRAGRVELGGTEQELRFRAAEFPAGTSEGVVDVNVSAVATAAGVDLSDLDVGRVAAAGATLTEATVLDRQDEVVRVAFEPDDPVDAVELAVTLAGLGTEGAEPTEDVPYYAVLLGDERPAAPPGPDYHDVESRFDVVEVEATEESRPPPEDTPQPERDEPDEPGGDDAAEDQHGFGVATALAALAALLARRLGDD